MERRAFLQLLTGGLAGIALEQAIPFGRVWSFPSKIVISTPEVFEGPTAIWYGMQNIAKNIENNSAIREAWAREFFRQMTEPEVMARLGQGDIRPGAFDKAFGYKAHRKRNADNILSRNRIIDYRKVVLTDS